MDNSNHLGDQFMHLMDPQVSLLTEEFYKNQRVLKALSDIASSRKLKEAIDKSGGVKKISDALTKYGFDKFKNAVHQAGGKENLDTAIDLLKVKNSSNSSAKNTLTGDKWEQIQIYKKDPKTLDWYLNKLNSRSLVAFAKKAENNGDKELKNKLSEIINKRKKNVQESINQRVQVNFRLSEQESAKIEEIQKWLKGKDSIPLLNQDLNVKKLNTATSLTKELLNIAIEYLYLASLNSRQINALSEMIVHHKKTFEDRCEQDWDLETNCGEDELTDEEGVPYNYDRYRKMCIISAKSLIIETASVHFDIPVKLIENDFWDIAEEKAEKIVKQLEQGEPLDKVSQLRSNILKDFID